MLDAGALAGVDIDLAADKVEQRAVLRALSRVGRGHEVIEVVCRVSDVLLRLLGAGRTDVVAAKAGIAGVVTVVAEVDAVQILENGGEVAGIGPSRAGAATGTSASASASA